MTKSREAKRQDLVAKAVRELEINVPLYRTVCRKDGTVEITTRDGTFTWSPSPKNQRVEA